MSESTENTQISKEQQDSSKYRTPHPKTLVGASRHAIVEDKPILLDYWTASLDKKAVIGERKNKEKLLVKSSEEFTSPIEKMFSSETDIIVMTQNSIYIVSKDIQFKRLG